jgi:hypothetical protein
MSAYVTYNVKAFDANGETIGSFPVRAVCKPEGYQALDLAREHYDDSVSAAEVERSVPAKIGRVTPAARRTVSARVKVLA